MALGAAAVLLIGPSGAGKTATALWMLALGARLVADDGTLLVRNGDSLITGCAPAIKGQIEARGVGILAAEPQVGAVLRLVVDLGQEETDRLPPRRETAILGVTVPLLHGAKNPDLPAVLMQYLKGGRTA